MALSTSCCFLVDAVFGSYGRVWTTYSLSIALAASAPPAFPERSPVGTLPFWDITGTTLSAIVNKRSQNIERVYMQARQGKGTRGQTCSSRGLRLARDSTARLGPSFFRLSRHLNPCNSCTYIEGRVMGNNHYTRPRDHQRCECRPLPIFFGRRDTVPNASL